TLALTRDVRTLQRYRYTLALAGVLALLMPLAPGIGEEINGNRLWIHLGGITFQPGELAKVLLVVFFGGYLAEKRELLATPTRRIGQILIPDVRHFGPLLLAWGLSLAVLIFEKDLGSSMLFFAIFLAM